MQVYFIWFYLEQEKKEKEGKTKVITMSGVKKKAFLTIHN